MAATFPTFTCEAAFGYAPGNSTPVYTDVSAYLRSFTISRGRQYELNQMQAGTAQITLRNLDRRFDPTNAAGPYYPNVLPMVPIRIKGTFASTTYTLFTGFVERWPQMRTGPTYAEVVVPAVDGFELLTQSILPGAAYPQELSGTRIGRVLDAVSWSSMARNLATGQSQIPAFSFSASDGVVALDHINDVVLAEIGQFFVSGAGAAVFLDRHSSIGTTSQVTLTDRTDLDAGAIGYSDLVATIDKDLVANDWIGTRNGGVTQEALNSTSITSYFRRSQTRTPLLTTDAEVLENMQFLLSQYKDPVLRFESATVTPGASATAWPHVLGREIGDRVTVREHPPGGGSAIVQDSFIQQINLTVDRHAASAQMTWGFLPVSILGFWTAGYSQAGTDTRAGY